MRLRRSWPGRVAGGGERSEFWLGDALPLASILERSGLPGSRAQPGARATGRAEPGSAIEAPAAGHVLKIAPTCFFADYGCHVRILEETLALQALGSRVTVCTYDLGRDFRGVRVRRAPRLPWRDSIHTGSTWHKLYVDALLGLRTAASAAARRPDVVHAHLHEGALIGWFVARASGAPLIFDFQGSLTAEMLDHDFLRPGSPLYRPLRALERRINRLADAIITSSANAKTLLARQFGYPSERIFPLPDSVNTERFRPRWEASPEKIALLRRHLGIPEGRKVVVYLGLLAEYQGSSQLLTAAKHILGQREDVHFVLMGHPGEERYRRTAHSLGIEPHVTFTGKIDYEVAPDYLAIGDVATSPKLSRTEANGKLLNYMAVGLPTVAYDTPVSREIMGPLGRYARAGDYVDLAAQVGALLDEPDAAALGRRLRRRAEEHFGWRDAGRRLMRIYEHVLERRAAR
jgi:glycosyltransferase involved in cell wall biosynthesis